MAGKPNYSEELTNKLISEYEANPVRETVERLAEESNKSVRSIIAKLSSAGVYKTPQRTTKTGEAIIKKSELVENIENWLGLPAESLPTLAKTSKLELKMLHARIADLINNE